MTTSLSRSQRASAVIINCGLVGLAGSAWAAQTMPNIVGPITGFTGIAVVAICAWALKASASSSLECEEQKNNYADTNDEPLSFIADADENSALSGSSVLEVEPDWLSKFGKSSRSDISHGDLYWLLLKDIEGRLPKIDGKANNKQSRYEITLNLINLYAGDYERSQSHIELTVQPDKVDMIIPD